MPKNSTGQGHSANTPIKQEAFNYFMSIHPIIVKKIAEKFSWVDNAYYYLETNAGTGHNHDGTNGSMNIALHKIQEQFQFYELFAIEKNCDAANTLTSFLHDSQVQNYSVIAGDNQHILMNHTPFNTDSKFVKFGLVYADPNGVDDLPLRALRRLFNRRDYQRIDVLINISANFLKRCRQAGQHKYNLQDILTSINKKHWYIRQLVGRDQWTFLFGTNWDKWPALRIRVNGLLLKGLDSLGMFSLHNIEGQQIWDHATLTSNEREKKSPMPLIAPIANTFDIHSFWQSGPRSCGEHADSVNISSVEHEQPRYIIGNIHRGGPLMYPRT